MDIHQSLTPPAIGEVWIGQGGIYAGIIPARNGAAAYHLVIGDGLGRIIWGPYDEISTAADLADGHANTQAMLAQYDSHPAAQAAAAYQADGYVDFYLPAVEELSEAWKSLSIQDWGWVWSSTQHSAFSAYILNFDDGTQSGYDKGLYFLVLPARQVPVL